MKKFYPKVASFIIIVIVITFAFYNCSKDDNPKSDPPNLPPVESFVMDFNSFDTDSSNVKVATYSNWFPSAVSVLAWSTLIDLYSVVPVAAFLNSFNYDPVYVKNSTWLWAYDFPVGSITYSAKLSGKLESDDVKWSMNISKSGLLGFDDFIWYQGTSQLDGAGATWTIYQTPSNPTEVISITWQKDLVNNQSVITYKNIIPNNAENGGYIRYGVTDDTTYNAFYHIYNKSADNLKKIEWNTQDKAGRVQDSILYSDTDWHYWNEMLQDITQ